MNYKFKSGWNAAKKDRDVLTQWENELIPIMAASRRIAKNNDWDDVQSFSEFTVMANSLGYFRGMKDGR